MTNWIALESLDQKIEYNASFILNDSAAKKLQHNAIYTNDQLYEIKGGSLNFIETIKGRKKPNRWRCVIS